VEKQKRIIVSVTNDLSTDQRVKKVCAFLYNQNFEVLLCGRQLNSSKPIIDRPYRIKRFKLLFNKGPLFYANYNLRLFWFLLSKKTTYLLANDLDTLLANAWIKRLKPKTVLVYDAHEYFTEVPEIQNKPTVKRIWQWIEHHSLPKVDHFYTVNQSIADLYQKKTAIPVKVVRNISDSKAFSLQYSKAELGLPENKNIVIIQGAGINIDRGAEEAVEAIKLVEGAVLIFVGDGDVIPSLKHKVNAENLSDKVLFFPKQPYEKLMNYTLHADVGLSLDKASNLNYQLALPNKLFDFIHAGIPIISSNLIEIKKIITAYEIGLIINNHNPIEIASKITQILTNSHLKSTFKENCKKAANDLTWQKETTVLETIYG
jgi:glycosyltransferase involved in cell wall biosynthesis